MKTSVLTIEKPDKPKLSTRIALLKMELQGWLNGQYLQQFRLAIAAIRQELELINERHPQKQ
jgi:hypothetical protein